MEKIKQTLTWLTTAFIAISLLSCGGGVGSKTSDSKANESASEDKKSDTGLAVLSTIVVGSLKDYIEVVDGKYPVEYYYSKADNKDDNKWIIKVKFKLLKKCSREYFEKNAKEGIKLVFYDNEKIPYSGNTDAKFQFQIFAYSPDNVFTLLEGEVGSIDWISFDSSVWIKKGDPLFMNFPKEIKYFKVVS